MGHQSQEVAPQHHILALLLSHRVNMGTRPIHKNWAWNFQKCHAVLCYILIDRQMLEKVFAQMSLLHLALGTTYSTM